MVGAEQAETAQADTRRPDDGGRPGDGGRGGARPRNRREAAPSSDEPPPRPEAGADGEREGLEEFPEPRAVLSPTLRRLDHAGEEGGDTHAPTARSHRTARAEQEAR